MIWYLFKLISAGVLLCIGIVLISSCNDSGGYRLTDEQRKQARLEILVGAVLIMVALAIS